MTALESKALGIALEKLNLTMKPTQEIDMGRTVLCDVCTENWTDRTESGGFLFGSYAYCPVCAESHLPKIKGYHEEHYIKARCPDGVAFADWVRGLRGGNNKIQFYNFNPSQL